MHTPPMTQPGMLDRKVTNGAMNAETIASAAVKRMVTTEALPEIATHPIDSP